MLIGSDVQKPHVRSADTAKIEDAASNRYALIDDDLILRHWRKDADGAARHPFSVPDDSPCPWTPTRSTRSCYRSGIMYKGVGG